MFQHFHRLLTKMAATGFPGAPDSIGGPDALVSKSYLMGSKGDDRKTLADYCLKHSTPMHPVQVNLMEETIKNESRFQMLGAPEVLMMNQQIIRTSGAKKILDIGVFTGASTLAAALALPEDKTGCKIVACDVSQEYMDKALVYWTEAGVNSVVEPMVGPATESLDKLILQGETGKYDFAFIDADKPNYWNYYEKILKLLRPGGTMAFDNTLWSGKVVDPAQTDANTMFLKELNEKIVKDTERTTTVLLNVGDGYTICVKK